MAADDASFFEPHVGAVFVAAGGEAGAVALQLVEVQRLPEQAGAPRPQPFTLTFTGPVDPPLPQGTFTVEPPGEESMALFLVPIGPDADGLPRYEAVFN